MALDLAAQLPGWEIIIFFALIFIFLLAGGITTFIILSRMRWPLKFVVVDTRLPEPQITIRGKCRVVGFGDGGEELFLLKRINKYRVGYGKRIHPKQVLWVIAEDGLWYQCSFSDLNKTLRELGVRPSSVNVRLGMSSVRKGLEKRLEPTDWLSKYGVFVGMGILFLMLLVGGAVIWYSSNQQVKVAQANAASLNFSIASQEQTQKTLSLLDNILARINIAESNPSSNNTIIGGSGLAPAG